MANFVPLWFKAAIVFGNLREKETNFENSSSVLLSARVTMNLHKLVQIGDKPFLERIPKEVCLVQERFWEIKAVKLRE